jgi:hypothetical protein
MILLIPLIIKVSAPTVNSIELYCPSLPIVMSVKNDGGFPDISDTP